MSEFANVFQDRMRFYKINGAEHRDIASRYITLGYPTYVLFQDGEYLGSHPGAFDDISDFQLWVQGLTD